jgi:hypothetical protein
MYSSTVKPLTVDKLSDEFGQYEILLTCECGHTRRCYPHTLAPFAGWDAKLEDVARRMRCSICGAKKCAGPRCAANCAAWTQESLRASAAYHP